MMQRKEEREREKTIREARIDVCEVSETKLKGCDVEEWDGAMVE